MMSDEAVLSRLIVVGASHRTSPEAMRDRLFIAEQDVARFLHGICAAGFTNAVALSTCARTEIFGLVSDMKYSVPCLITWTFLKKIFFEKI